MSNAGPHNMEPLGFILICLFMTSTIYVLLRRNTYEDFGDRLMLSVTFAAFITLIFFFIIGFAAPKKTSTEILDIRSINTFTNRKLDHYHVNIKLGNSMKNRTLIKDLCPLNNGQKCRCNSKILKKEELDSNRAKVIIKGLSDESIWNWIGVSLYNEKVMIPDHKNIPS